MSSSLRLSAAAGLSSNQLRSSNEMTNSASLAKAERQIKSLTLENEDLRKQLAEISGMYKQLITENTHENFDERRVILLKSQLIQMERQVLLLNEALGSRAAVLLDIENVLAATANHCRGLLGGTVRGMGSANVARSDLDRILESVESCRVKLYKNIENSTSDNLKKPLLMFEHFVRGRPPDVVTLLDVCSGSTEHLNLKHVGCLESELVQLYRQLCSLSGALRVVSDPRTTRRQAPDVGEVTDVSAVSGELPGAVYQRLSSHITKSCTLLRRACQRLLELSVLVPAAPLPILTQSVITDLTPERVLDTLKLRSNGRVAMETKNMIDGLLKALNYSISMTAAEKTQLETELDFHRDVYQLQSDYVDNLFTSLRRGCASFEQDARENLCKPLEAVLSSFSSLQGTASEQALRQFITVVKQHQEQLREVVASLSLNEKQIQDKEEALAEYGTHFVYALERLRSDCRRRRDTDLASVINAKTQRDEHLAELSGTLVCDATTTPDTPPSRSVIVIDRKPAQTGMIVTDGQSVGAVSKDESDDGTSERRARRRQRLTRRETADDLCSTAGDGVAVRQSLCVNRRSSSLKARPPWVDPIDCGDRGMSRLDRDTSSDTESGRGFGKETASRRRSEATSRTTGGTEDGVGTSRHQRNAPCGAEYSEKQAGVLAQGQDREHYSFCSENHANAIDAKSSDLDNAAPRCSCKLDVCSPSSKNNSALSGMFQASPVTARHVANGTEPDENVQPCTCGAEHCSTSDVSENNTTCGTSPAFLAAVDDGLLSSVVKTRRPTGKIVPGLAQCRLVLKPKNDTKVVEAVKPVPVDSALSSSKTVRSSVDERRAVQVLHPLSRATTSISAADERKASNSEVVRSVRRGSIEGSTAQAAPMKRAGSLAKLHTRNDVGAAMGKPPLSKP